MHCVVNELGKGTLHTANTTGMLCASSAASVELGTLGGGRHCDWARRAPHRVLSPRGAE